MFPEKINEEELVMLQKTANTCRGNILTMTTLASSGHPGGSMSSIDMLLTIYKYADISPDKFKSDNRDRVVVSIGHISPAVYSCLGANGFFNIDEAISEFRLAGSIYEGHIERYVNGVEWTTGNLGQGLSVAAGMAYANKFKGLSNYTYVLMGDGEHQKGQISEARRFAAKFKLDHLIAFLDCNGLQISGDVSAVMPQDIEAEYKADGWAVLHTDGHSFTDIAATIAKAQKTGKPTLIIAKTIMGKGVSFMENKEKYHGSTLSEDDYKKAMQELGLHAELDKYKAMRSAYVANGAQHSVPEYSVKLAPKAQYYSVDTKTDCRSAAGATVTEIVRSSLEKDNTPVLVFDCDLAGSVKTGDIQKNYPENFVQCGISEHHAATASGAASASGIVCFYTGFTIFAVDEVYNQLRMNDINHSNLKVFSTHAGIDVGEDGPTHQCIDYLGLMRNVFGFKVFVPADPNQTDHIMRHAASFYGNANIIMGRSKLTTLADENGNALFGENYKYEYGKIDTVRSGKTPLLSFGGMVEKAIKVKEIAEKSGLSVGVYNVSTPIEPNEDEIIKLADNGIIFVYEDHISQSGLYATVCNIIAKNGIKCKVKAFGVTNYAYSGTPDSVYKLIGLDPQTVANAIIKEVK